MSRFTIVSGHITAKPLSHHMSSPRLWQSQIGDEWPVVSHRIL